MSKNLHSLLLKKILKLQVCPGWSEKKITFRKLIVHFKPWFSCGSQLSICGWKKNQPTCPFIPPLLLIRKVRSHLYNIGVAGSSFSCYDRFSACARLSNFPSESISEHNEAGAFMKSLLFSQISFKLELMGEISKYLFLMSCYECAQSLIITRGTQDVYVILFIDVRALDSRELW